VAKTLGRERRRRPRKPGAAAAHPTGPARGRTISAGVRWVLTAGGSFPISLGGGMAAVLARAGAAGPAPARQRLAIRRQLKGWQGSPAEQGGLGLTGLPNPGGARPELASGLPRIGYPSAKERRRLRIDQGAAPGPFQADPGRRERQPALTRRDTRPPRGEDEGDQDRAQFVNNPPDPGWAREDEWT
jgi:hypothetical protein